MNRASLTRYAWLSIAAAIVTIALKTVAWRLTGSVGLLSDAAESLVNLVGAVIALAMLIIAARPPDTSHNFGHSKAEYFASGAEGVLILLAAASIGVAAVLRFFVPHPLEQAGAGLAVSVVASLINFVVARILARAGKQHDSITLEADAQHLMTDVWTSVGVIAAVALVALTGWGVLDPIVALAVALNIIWSAVHLLHRSAAGLMDTALPPEDQRKIMEILDRYSSHGIRFHALCTRQSAERRFVTVHVLVPGCWTTHHGHHVMERIEADIRAVLANTTVLTHMEPVEDPVSLQDINIDRG